MKNSKSKFLFVAILCSLFFTACEKTDDPITTGTDREKFLGNWSGNSTGVGGTRYFNVTVTASNSNTTQVLLNNFDGVGVGSYIVATVSGNSMTFESTLIGQDRYDGSASISNNVLSFNFTIDDGQSIENRSGSATK